MRNIYLGSLTMCCILFAAVPAWAEEEALPKKISMKLLRGVANLSTGWIELGKQPYLVGAEHGWVMGVLRGPFDGIGMFVARTVGGAYEILTFPLPIPPSYRPLVQPNFSWQPELPSSAP